MKQKEAQRKNNIVPFKKKHPLEELETRLISELATQMGLPFYKLESKINSI